MLGLYSLKPWFTQRLTPARRRLVRHRVTPHTITLFGVLFAAGAAACLAALPAPAAAAPVAVLLVLRLACANLDGSLARETGSQTRWGSVLNELGDRGADMVMLAGLLPHVPLPLALGTLLTASIPSWISLAGAAAGSPRINGGPIGKTERCLLVVLAAASGFYVVAAAVIAVGSVLTGALRVLRIWARCRANDQHAPASIASSEPVRS